MNSIRVSRAFFVRFAAGLEEHSVEQRCASAVLSRRSADEFLFSLCTYIYQEEAESTDEEGEPKQKKQKTDKKKKKKKKNANSDSENSDVIDDLSGDEVDQSNIIAGGRASRSTRPVFTKQMYAAANLEDESEDEE